MSMYHYWGKTNLHDDRDVDLKHLLPYHNLDVGACFYVLLKRHPAWWPRLSSMLDPSHPDRFKRGLTFLACLHDFGKFAGSFQNKSVVARHHEYDVGCDDRVRHDVNGFAVLTEEGTGSFPWRGGFLSSYIDHPWVNTTENPYSRSNQKDRYYDFEETYDDHCEERKHLFAPFFGHHGYPPHSLDSDRVQKNKIHVHMQWNEQNKEDAHQFLNEMINLSDFEDASLCMNASEDDLARASWLINGIMSLADWMGSDIDWKTAYDPDCNHTSPHIPYHDEAVDLSTYWNHSLERAKRKVDHTNIIPSSTSHVHQDEAGFDALYGDDFDLRPMQRVADEEIDLDRDGSHLFLIEDLTGSGKTEAAMSLFHRLINRGDAHSMYMALPTQASSNQMFERMDEVCQTLFDEDDPGTVTLAHGAKRQNQTYKSLNRHDPNNQSDDWNADVSKFLMDNNECSLLGQVGIGTIDQLLMSVLKSDHQTVRSLALDDKVVIVDEVHAYEAYQQRLLKTFLRMARRRGIHVILMSATMPNRLKKACLSAYGGMDDRKDEIEREACPREAFPTLSHVASDMDRPGSIDVYDDIQPHDRKTVHIDKTSNQHDVIRSLVGEARDGKCVCWIRNTVKNVRAAYAKIVDVYPEKDVHIAHSRFVDRARAEQDRWAEASFGRNSGPDDRAGQIVIASQVFEQSLDLDFDVMATDLAPVDLMIQRIGRMCRHYRDRFGEYDPDLDDRTRTPKMIVYGPPSTDDPDEDWYRDHMDQSKFIYNIDALLWKTDYMLSSGEWHFPEDVRSLIESVYGTNLSFPDAWDDEKVWDDWNDYDSRLKAKCNEIVYDDGYLCNHDNWNHSPTRDALPSQTFELYVRKDGSLVPIAYELYDDIDEDSYRTKRESQLSVPFYRGTSDGRIHLDSNGQLDDHDLDGIPDEQIEDIMDHLPPWIEPLVLEEISGSPSWKGEGKLSRTKSNGQKEVNVFRYHEDKGLIFI